MIGCVSQLQHNIKRIDNYYREKYIADEKLKLNYCLIS